MKKPVLALTLVVVLAAIGAGGWAVFEHFERADKIKDAKKSCSGLDVVTPGATLPAGFTLPPDQKLLRVEKQGKTSVVYASVDGERKDLVAIRDRVVEALEDAGYKKTHTDQEPTFEADAGVSKAGIDDSINVRPLCAGKAVVRYTLH
ncbi:MAG: hypothetical protein QOE05_3219 [Actinomycetota bacterium]|jgi:hypothetical protein|nr:hypothetical protein [Actinomycetota bacterium]